MQSWVTGIMEQFGYLGIFLMMALENIFPPIPSEIVLPFGGFLSTYTVLTGLGVLTAATLGSVLGAMVLYGIGLLVDFKRLENITVRHGKLLRLDMKDINKTNAWFEKYGYRAVFFCRMIPLVRSLISIPAGMSRMNFPAFIILTLLGTLVWNTLLISAGVVLGENWEAVLGIMSIYSSVIYIVLAAAIVILIFLYLRRK
jgi:membrane protein DedA with SNARE-associated domain